MITGWPHEDADRQGSQHNIKTVRITLARLIAPYGMTSHASRSKTIRWQSLTL